MLEVTNVDEGQRVLRDSGLNCTVAKGMKNAAEKVVALANQQQAAALLFTQTRYSNRPGKVAAVAIARRR
jgi:hypothetical protein